MTDFNNNHTNQNRTRSKSVSWHKVAFFLATGVALLFVFSFLFSGANTIVSEKVVASVESTVDSIEELANIAIESVNGVPVKEGTYEQIKSASEDIVNSAEAEAIAEINAYYDSLIPGVDSYLDWYYSMSGQWSQLWNMVEGVFSGDFTDHVAAYIGNQMALYITPDTDLGNALSSIVTSANAAITDAANEIVAKNRIVIDESGNIEYTVTIDKTIGDIIAESTPEIFRNAGKIAGGSLFAGFSASFIASRIASKAIGTRIGKMAISEAAQKVVTKAVSFSVPVLGFVVSVPLDYFFTKADEILNRDAYRAEILSTIEVDRQHQIELVRVSFDAYMQGVNA